MNLHPKCLARSRPSVTVTVSKRRNVIGRHDGSIREKSVRGRNIPFMPTCRSYSRSHLLAIRMTGKLSLSFTRRICWWNVLISSKEFREVMEYTSKKPSPVRMYCSLMAL